MLSAIRLAVLALAAVLFVLPASAVETGSAAWTTDGWVSMPGALYSGPGKRYDEVGSIGAGERVRVDRCSYRWCQIHTAAVRGWLSLDNLSFGQRPDGLFAGPKFPTQRGGSGQVTRLCVLFHAQRTGSRPLSAELGQQSLQLVGSAQNEFHLGFVEPRLHSTHELRVLLQKEAGQFGQQLRVAANALHGGFLI